MSYTPGPWFAVEYAGLIQLHTEPFYGNNDLLDADNVGIEKATANGKLAACSPELLESLQELLFQINKYIPDGDYINWGIVEKAELLVNKALNQ